MNDPTGAGGRKSLAVYAINERNGKNFWLKIGAAFTNRDGSLTLYLDALPVNSNRLQVREPKVWDDARPANGAAAAEPAEAQP
jgi:hypothetical protein